MFKNVFSKAFETLSGALLLAIFLFLIIVIITYFQIEKRPYLIQIAVVGNDLEKKDCNPGAVEYVKEQIKSEAYRYIKSSASFKSREFYQQNIIGSKDELRSAIDNISEGNDFVELLRIFWGDKPQIMNVFISTQKGNCAIAGASIFFKNQKYFVPLSDMNDVSLLSRQIVDRIDEYIPVAELAYNHRTLFQARKIAFKKISEGTDTIWYKNLVAMTYLQETDIYSHDSQRQIVNGLHDNAEYWVRKALDEDQTFLPALFNLIYIEIERSGHTSKSYDDAIQKILNLYYRTGSSDCLVRIAQLHLNRYDRMRSAKKSYLESQSDIARAREFLEFKIRKFGPEPRDIELLSIAVSYSQWDEYRKYLHSASAR